MHLGGCRFRYRPVMLLWTRTSTAADLKREADLERLIQALLVAGKSTEPKKDGH
jgi:hypothetical protein